ncbi:MAG: Stk1 family PASTA domain-containing Ser/Thr kinase [Defluviitaleaceae bacterium]|nr:Stk1 family PASTA domain-containing Ser/Thr kinase [Defluviitaleaceae bacterium]
MIISIGSVISGRYKIMEQIGSGGMSYVYRALDTKLDRDVTFKVLREEYVNDANFLARFDTEARAVASLNHPNIVDIYDVDREGDVKYIVMEYVHGKTLKELISERAPFTNEVMLSVAEQITAALIHAHESGIIHKDIKPQNILVMPNGAVKVADFGIAADKNSRLTLTEEGSTMGSVHYISPEAASNSEVDQRSDLYSLGITMFEMMTATLPFDSENADEIPMMHMEAPFPNITRLNSATLPMVREIITKLTNKAAYRRYQSANSLYNDIQRAIMESTKYRDFNSTTSEGSNNHHTRHDIGKQQPKKPAPRAGRKTPADKKREMIFIGGGIAAAVLVLVGLGFLISWVVGMFNNDDPEFVTVPVLVGQNIEWVRENIENLGLELDETWESNEEVPYGYVIRSEPTTAGDVLLDFVVRVWISDGSVYEQYFVVPDITGLSISAARDAVANLPIYLAEQESVFSSTVPAGHIISQNPEYPTEIPHGGRIYIVLSFGSQAQMATVPNLISLTRMAAESAIRDAGLDVGEITMQQSATHPANTVMSQSVPANMQLHPGVSIDLVISNGNVPPDTGEPSTEPPTEAPTEPPTETPTEPTTEPETQPPTEPPTEAATQAPVMRTFSFNPVLSVEDVSLLEIILHNADGSFTTIQTQSVTAADMPFTTTAIDVSNALEVILRVNGTVISTVPAN